MLYSFEDLRQKEVIDVRTGEKLGYIDDIRIDTAGVSAAELIIYGSRGFLGFFGSDDDITFHCGEIKVIGNDVILIDRHDCL